jgi:hypothetical protein
MIPFLAVDKILDLHKMMPIFGTSDIDSQLNCFRLFQLLPKRKVYFFSVEQQLWLGRISITDVVQFELFIKIKDGEIIP